MVPSAGGKDKVIFVEPMLWMVGLVLMTIKEKIVFHEYASAYNFIVIGNRWE